MKNQQLKDCKIAALVKPSFRSNKCIRNTSLGFHTVNKMVVSYNTSHMRLDTCMLPYSWPLVCQVYLVYLKASPLVPEMYLVCLSPDAGSIHLPGMHSFKPHVDHRWKVLLPLHGQRSRRTELFSSRCQNQASVVLLLLVMCLLAPRLAENTMGAGPYGLRGLCTVLTILFPLKHFN